MMRKPNCVCKICNKQIYRRPKQLQTGNVYCSQICNGLNQRTTKTCKVCLNNFLGNKTTCSRSCANKARTGIIYTKENVFNKAYKGSRQKEMIATLRGGICERCHENNYAILQVHHKIERYKGGSDDTSNLELLCPNCHFSHHLGCSLFINKKGDTVLARQK